MRKIFQMIFCILSAISVVATVFLGIFGDIPYVLIGIASALFFLVLTLFTKYGNPLRRPKEGPKTDFMNSDEENEQIKKSLEQEQNSETK